MEGLEAKLHHVLAGSESPKTLTLEKTKKEEKEDTDPARDEQRDVHQDARWSKLSEAKQARLLEQCFSKLYGIPKPKARTLPQRPSKRWLMQTPCTAEPGELGHLCEICRHVDFHYLVNCPLAQVLESFKLFPLKWPLLRQEDCAFCRLVAKTVRGALGDRQIMTEAQGKDIMCDFRMLPKAVKTAGRAEMILRLIPQPQGIDDFTYLVLSEYHAEQDVMKRMTNHGVSVEVPRVDCEMIKRWCHRCVSGQCGSNPSVIQDRDLPHGFRLIDVSQQCVVAYKQGDQYVTLSYVWGGVATLRNTKALCKDLAVSGALIHEKHRLPNTIKDAMALVEMLGERYIWVDSLCIIQDDEDDKAIQIAAMDQIYSSSVLTLVAASGDNADVGLPGMSAGPRKFQRHIENVQGLYFANLPRRFELAIGESVWNSRAWTLQERVSSPRVLTSGYLARNQASRRTAERRIPICWLMRRRSRWRKLRSRIARMWRNPNTPAHVTSGGSMLASLGVCIMSCWWSGRRRLRIGWAWVRCILMRGRRRHLARRLLLLDDDDECIQFRRNPR